MTNSTSTLARVARTPEPPYYAVTTTTELGATFDSHSHLRLGEELYLCALAMPGFIGLEVFFQDNASIAVSYWRDLASIQAWRVHPLHASAKAMAKSDWFGATITRIARVESDYGFNLDSLKI